jgi:copper chaperone CopZ
MNINLKYFQVIMIITCLLFGLRSLMAQQQKTDTVSIKTSAVCSMCKERIEQGLAFEKGIKDVNLDLSTKIVKVIYNTGKITPEAIRKKITSLGYDADDLQADVKAYNKLPSCCKKDASGDH